MKNLFTFFAAVVLTANVFAQAPQKMSYQAVIRNSSNALVSSTAVSMRISILQGSTTGTAVYVETQAATTNANGLASIEIGAGTAVTGTFAGIDWSAGPYFIKTETDPAGGTTYSITGTSQLLSVPYALSAAGIANPTGLVVPKLTSTQIAALPVSPAPYGTLVYNTTTNAFVGYRSRSVMSSVNYGNGSSSADPQILGVSEEIRQTFNLTNASAVGNPVNLSIQILPGGTGVISGGVVTLKVYSGTYGSGTLLGTYTTSVSTANNGLSFSNISSLVLPAGAGYFTLATDSTASLRLMLASTTSVSEAISGVTTTSNAQCFLNNQAVVGKCQQFSIYYNFTSSVVGWSAF